MADSKISDLTALTSSASDDILPIVDTSATATKKMTIENMFKSIPVSVGVNESTPLAKLHVVRDAVNHSTQSSLAPIFVEDDTRPGIFISGNLNNIGIIQFGDNSAINSGEIFYAHSDDKFSFRAAGTVQATLSDGVFAPETDSDVDLGTTSLRFKDTFVDTLTTTGNVTVGGDLSVTGDIDFTEAAITNVTSIGLDSIFGDGDADTSITFSGSNVITFKANNANQITMTDGAMSPVTDSDVDLGTTSLRYKDAFVDSITVTGEIDGASLDIEGNADINGTTNLDVVDIDGAVDMATTLTLGGNADFNGDLDVDGTTNLDVVDIDGAVDMASTLTVAEAINGALKRWTVKTSAYTAVAGDRLLADTATTAAFTITLPSAPAVGDEIHILDSAANFDSANLTVARNGKKIQGLTADLTLTTENTGIGLVFMSDTYGWRVLVDAYAVDTTEL